MTGFVAVLLYVGWMQLLTLAYAFPRVPMALFGNRKFADWERAEANRDPPFMVRAKGAHLNCVENFPLFAAVVVVAALMGKSSVVDGLAFFILLARMGQSLSHLIGTAPALVLLRATFFLAQVGMIFWVCYQLIA
ncbi:MAG: MAPEG family protein [Pseudomonadota bacterium]